MSKIGRLLPKWLTWRATRRSEIEIGHIVAIPTVQCFRIESTRHTSTGYDGYGEDWEYLYAVAIDPVSMKPLKPKQIRMQLKIPLGFYAEEGDNDYCVVSVDESHEYIRNVRSEEEEAKNAEIEWFEPQEKK